MAGEIAKWFVGLGVTGGGEVKAQLQDVKREMGGLSMAANVLKGALSAGAVYAIGQTAQEAYKLGKAGAQALELRDAFRQVVPAAEDMLRALKRASGGTIAETDLMLAANRAAMLGVSTSAEQMGQLMEVARFRARAMGLDTTQAFSDIVTGLGRMSPLILDNLGLVFDTEAEFANYATSLGKTASALTEAEKKQALLNATLRVGQKQIAEAGGLAESNADNFRIFETAIADAKTELSELIGKWEIWNTLAKGAQESAAAIEEASARRELVESYQSEIDKALEAGKVTSGQAAHLRELMGAYNMTAGSMEEFQERMAKAMAAEGLKRPLLDYLNTVTQVTSDAEDEWRSYIQTIGSSLAVGALGSFDWLAQSADTASGAVQNLATQIGLVAFAMQDVKDFATGSPALRDYSLAGPGSAAATGGAAGREAWRENREALSAFLREQNLKDAADAEKTAKDVARAWESAYEDVKGYARGAMGSLTFSFDYAGIMDQLGFHQETWDEEARRAMDVVNQGAASPWYQQMIEKGQLTPERLAKFGGDPRAAAAEWIHEFEMGQHPEAINMDAAAKNMYEGITKKENWEGLWGGLATTWQSQLQEESDTVKDVGKASMTLVMQGMAAGVKENTSILQLMAEAVSPLVWKYVQDRMTRTGAIP